MLKLKSDTASGGDWREDGRSTARNGVTDRQTPFEDTIKAMDEALQ